jgi:hypothetical protein
VVLLLRTNDGEEWVTMAKDEGSFRFVDLPPGFYNVRVQGEGSHVSGVMLDGKNVREVELAVAGWGHTVQNIETTGARGPVIRCRVENKPGVTVQAHNGDWHSEPVITGSAPEIGPDGCEIVVVEPGYYVVEATGLTALTGEAVKLEAYVNVERSDARFHWSSLSIPTWSICPPICVIRPFAGASLAAAHQSDACMCG